MLLTRLGVPKLWREDPELLWPYLLRYTVSPITLWLVRGSYGYGLDRVPAEGGGVIAANHLSAIDPPLLGAFSPRSVYFMAKAELFAIPVVGEAFMWAGGFPIRRGEGDRESLRQAREIVRDGHMVGVFVEGTRQRFGYPGEVHPGAVMIAMQEEAPVVPCGIYSFGWTRKNRMSCAVVWGERMRLDGYPRSGRGYREAAEALRAELLRLWRLAAEAVAAGFPPRLADGAVRSGLPKPSATRSRRSPRPHQARPTRRSRVPRRA